MAVMAQPLHGRPEARAEVAPGPDFLYFEALGTGSWWKEVLMSIRLLAATLAVAAVPATAMEQRPASERAAQAERRYCVVDNDPAGRLRNIRRCYTKAERDAMRRETRETIDRIQTRRASY